jgi:hypothetical protein
MAAAMEVYAGFFALFLLFVVIIAIACVLTAVVQAVGRRRAVKAAPPRPDRHSGETN